MDSSLLVHSQGHTTETPLFLLISLSSSLTVEEVLSANKLRTSAELAFSKGQSDESLKLWAKVIELEPNNEQNYYKRFRVNLRLQRYSDALNDLNSALAIKPSFDQALSQRAKLNLRLGNCRESIQDFNRLNSYAPPPLSSELLSLIFPSIGSIHSIRISR